MPFGRNSCPDQEVIGDFLSIIPRPALSASPAHETSVFGSISERPYRKRSK